MGGLWNKWHSRSGESILLALLMFFVCCMAAASVLAAAGSNAGRARGGRTEQQKRLTLSSAVELVCARLQESGYTGKYRVYEWTVNTPYPLKDAAGNKVTDPDGNDIMIPSYENFFYCTQLAGEWTAPDPVGLLPLDRELNAMFGERFAESGCEKLTGTAVQPTAQTHTLTVTLPPGLEGYPYPGGPGPAVYQVPDTVTLEVVLDHSTWHLAVTAWLGTGPKPADGADTLTAELVAGNLPERESFPWGYTPAASAPALAEGIAVREVAAGTLQWKLNWIRKGGEG